MAELESRQCDPISPLAFISLLERVMEPVECNPATSGVNIHGLTIKDLRYADDVDLLDEEEKDLQSVVDQLHATSTEYGLQINANISKERHSDHCPTVTAGTEVLECVCLNLPTLEVL